LSRLEAPTGTNGWHFIPVGGSNRDQRVAFYPGEDLQPGQIASPRTSSHPSILFNSHPPLSYLISSSPSPRGFPSLSILKLPASHPSPPSRRGWPGAAALRLGTQVAVAWGGAAALRPARRPLWLARRRRPPPGHAGRRGLARRRHPPPGAQAGMAWPGAAALSRVRSQVEPAMARPAAAAAVSPACGRSWARAACLGRPAAAARLGLGGREDRPVRSGSRR